MFCRDLVAFDLVLLLHWPSLARRIAYPAESCEVSGRRLRAGFRMTVVGGVDESSELVRCGRLGFMLNLDLAEAALYRRRLFFAGYSQIHVLHYRHGSRRVRIGCRRLALTRLARRWVLGSFRRADLCARLNS